jgi:hypothetical protein
MWIVVYGNPQNGFSYAGTFDSMETACDWADENVAREYDWWIAPMIGV